MEIAAPSPWPVQGSLAGRNWARLVAWTKLLATMGVVLAAVAFLGARASGNVADRDLHVAALDGTVTSKAKAGHLSYRYYGDGAPTAVVGTRGVLPVGPVEIHAWGLAVSPVAAVGTSPRPVVGTGGAVEVRASTATLYRADRLRLVVTAGGHGVATATVTDAPDPSAIGRRAVAVFRLTALAPWGQGQRISSVVGAAAIVDHRHGRPARARPTR